MQAGHRVEKKCSVWGLTVLVWPLYLFKTPKQTVLSYPHVTKDTHCNIITFQASDGNDSPANYPTHSKYDFDCDYVGHIAQVWVGLQWLDLFIVMIDPICNVDKVIVQYILTIHSSVKHNLI